VSETEKPNLKNLEIKLKNLLVCVLHKAETDSEFARQLEEALLSDSLHKVVSPNKKRSKRINFNAVDYLHQNAESELRNELENKTDDELKQILQTGSNKKAKDLKNIERKQLVDDIISNANRVLKQGSSFLQVNDAAHPPSNNSGAAD
jgi:hypothetical protein